MFVKFWASPPPRMAKTVFWPTPTMFSDMHIKRSRISFWLNVYDNKISLQNTYFSVSEHSASFSLFFFPRNLLTGGLPPPPFTDKSATNRFFYAFPNSLMMSLLRPLFNIMCWYYITYKEIFKTRFHAVNYIGPMPRLVQIATCFFGIIHCMCFDVKSL